MAGTIGLKPSVATVRRLTYAAPPLSRLLHLVIAQTYATSAFATARPQLDNDYYYHNNNEENQKTGSDEVPMTHAKKFVPTRGVQWAFVGSPGARKHVYAEKVSKLLEVPHISVGSLVRQDLSPSSSLYKQIANAVNQGKLVPEDIMFGLLSKRLEDGYCKGETGFILDGIPRTQIQAVKSEVLYHMICPDSCLLYPDFISWYLQENNLGLGNPKYLPYDAQL